MCLISTVSACILLSGYGVLMRSLCCYTNVKERFHMVGHCTKCGEVVYHLDQPCPKCGGQVEASDGKGASYVSSKPIHPFFVWFWFAVAIFNFFVVIFYIHAYSSPRIRYRAALLLSSLIPYIILVFVSGLLYLIVWYWLLKRKKAAPSLFLCVRIFELATSAIISIFSGESILQLIISCALAGFITSKFYQYYDLRQDRFYN